MIRKFPVKSSPVPGFDVLPFSAFPVLPIGKTNRPWIQGRFVRTGSVTSYTNYGVVDVLVAAAGAPEVFVAAGALAFPTTMATYTSSPKNCPVAVDIRQLLRRVPVLFGAVIGTEIS